MAESRIKGYGDKELVDGPVDLMAVYNRALDLWLMAIISNSPAPSIARRVLDLAKVKAAVAGESFASSARLMPA